jgi:hypothetical protein
MFSQRFLTIYSGVVTLAFASVVLLGAREPATNAQFDQITVHRINVVEPDGTTRYLTGDEFHRPAHVVQRRAGDDAGLLVAGGDPVAVEGCSAGAHGS